MSEFDYDLPEERIAQHPLPERDKSKLLVYRNGEVSSAVFGNIYSYIPDDSLLVFNNTRVVRARLLFRRKSGAPVEIFCLEPLTPGDYEQSFASKVPVEWKCLIGNLKKWKKETLKMAFNKGRKEHFLTADYIGEEEEAWRIRFSWNSHELAFAEVMEAAGHIPLPPYITREDSEEDITRYQTVYSTVKGSVAAPTAGLHFTQALLDNLQEKGVKRTELTLHVGAGTFQPVKTKGISGHEMHAEHFFVTRETIELLLDNHNKIIAVGTTTCRTLESLYWLGVKVINEGLSVTENLFLDQWYPYTHVSVNISIRRSIEALLKQMSINKIEFITASTRAIIVPGYDFKMISGLITNFHQPKSTLLLLVSAWTGENWKKIYRYALDNNFRFLSYGDTSLLFR